MSIISKHDDVLDGNVLECVTCHIKSSVVESHGVCKECFKCGRHRKHYRCVHKDKQIHHCPEKKKSCETCHLCPAKCKCWDCPKCKHKIRSNRTKQTMACKVKTCGACANCCTCIKCRVCFKIYKKVEDDKFCTSCKTCCKECHCPSVRMSDERSGVHFQKSKDFKLNPIKRFISAEIEVAGCRKKKYHHVDEMVKKYQAVVKPDGSLPSGGFEINTSPAEGDKWIEEITDLCAALDQQEAFVNTSCGLHVHIDARDFDYLDLRRLALLYANVETQLYALVDDGRKRNGYCKPCGPYYKKYLTSLEKGTVTSRTRMVESIIRSNAQGYDYNGLDGRYHGLNLQSYWVHKTVECRIHQGSLDAEKIIRWGMLWASILEYAKTHSDLEVESLKTTGWELLFDLAPTEEIKFWIAEHNQKAKSKKAEKDKTASVG